MSYYELKNLRDIGQEKQNKETWMYKVNADFLSLTRKKSAHVLEKEFKETQKCVSL